MFFFKLQDRREIARKARLGSVSAMRQILFIEVQEARDLLGKTSGEELFLLGRERTDRVDLLHTRGLCVAHHKKHKGKISQTRLDLDTILDTTIIRNEGGGKMTTEKRRDSRPTRRC
jgi:hypothetical protein